MGRAIVVTSGKGGVGKSSVSANVGAALALAGSKVLLIDTDIGLRNLDILLGMEDKVVYDVVDLCRGECDFKKAVIKSSLIEGLYLLPAAQAKDKEAITPLQMKNVIKKAKEEFDYIFTDCPAGMDRGFENAVAGADDAIVVVTPDSASIRDADRMIAHLEEHDITDIKLVINKMRPDMVKEGKIPSVEEIVTGLSIDLLGVIKDDEAVIAASNSGECFVLNEKSKAGAACKNIACRLKGEKVDLMDLSDRRNVFARIFKGLVR